MKRVLMAVAAALLVAGSAPAFAQASERVTAPVGGISIEKPAGWGTLPPGEALSNLRKLEFDSPEFQQLIERNASAPLIVFTKYPVSHGGIIPTIKVNYRRLPQVRQLGAVGVINAVIETLRRGFGEVTVLDAPAETRVGGQPAARARVAFTIQSNGEALENISEMWIIPRGDYILILGVGYPANEPEATHAEILAAVGSVRIAP